MITLDEIQNISLRKSGLGGYKIEDVDSFIDKVIEKVKSLESSKRDLEQRIEAQDKEIQKYKEQEDSVQSALISAQMTAKQIVMEATKKSDEQLSESKEKADKLINDAKVRAEKINAETDAKTEEIMNKALRESSQKIEENNKILDAQKRSILLLQVIQALYMLTQRYYTGVGFYFNHYSNGATNFPNRGFNGFELSLLFGMNAKEAEIAVSKEPVDDGFKRHFQFDVQVSGGVMGNEAYYDYYVDNMGGGKNMHYPKFAFQADCLYKYCRTHATGIGLDLFVTPFCKHIAEYN